jgi:DNA-binding protein Fis
VLIHEINAFLILEYTVRSKLRFPSRADSIHKLQDKLRHLQSDILDISRRKSEGQEDLKDLHKEIISTREKLDLVKKTFNIKYEELKEGCSQLQRLQNYVEQFKDGQDYQELESIVRSEVEKTLLDNKKLLQNAFFSILLALRNNPDRYFIVDKVKLSPFTSTIINYESFLALRRASYPQRSEQLSSGRVLELAERIFYNLQKGIVDSTISTEVCSYGTNHVL